MAIDAQDVKRHGKHYTPTSLALFLADRVIAHAPVTGVLRVLDPACGDGELLFAIHDVAASLRPNLKLIFEGYDLDPQAIEQAELRATERGIEGSWHVADFIALSSTLEAASYDVIITNPPYVRTQHLGQGTAQLLAAEFGLTGRIDLTHPFVSLAPRLLSQNGVLGLLCSNRFLTTRAGANVRGVLHQQLAVLELFDLGDTRLFNAAVLPAITIAARTRPEAASSIRFASAYETEESSATEAATLFEALLQQEDSVIQLDSRLVGVRVGTLATSGPKEPWRISHAHGDDWLAAVASATWKTFGEVARVRVGIKTTADSVFISDTWDNGDLTPEESMLLPLITHRNLEPWRVSPYPRTRVLYPYDLRSAKRSVLSLSEAPRTRAYLDRHAERLKSRKYVTDGGREWFEIWVPQSPSAWSAPKVVFPDISERGRFALDYSGAVVNGDCYWISIAEIGSEDLGLLMIAVANSNLGLRFYDEVCGNKLYSGRRRWISQYVSRLPIPDPTSSSAMKLIELARSISKSGAASATDLELIESLVEEAFSKPIEGQPADPRSDVLF